MFRIAAWICVLACSWTAPSFAARIVVSGQGSGTTLQDAIDAAAPGDLLILEGVFLESVVIDKPLKIRGPAPIDGGCAGATDTVRITSSDVQLHNLVVYGGTHAAISIDHVNNVKLSKIAVTSASFPGGCPDGQYGIDVVGSTNVRLSKVRSTHSGAGLGFTGAFAHFDSIPANGRVKMTRAFTNYAANVRDVLVENSGTGAGGVWTVRIQSNDFVGDHTGVAIVNSSGIEVMRNYIGGHNWYSPTPTDGGVVLDATSTLNVVTRNRFYLNVPDIRDFGTDNVTEPNRHIEPIPG